MPTQHARPESLFSAAVSALNAAAFSPSLFIFSTGSIFVGSSLSPVAAELLSALHSKATEKGFRIAIISGEGPVSPLQVVNMAEESKLGSVLTTHLATGPNAAATALLHLRNSSGVTYSEMLLFAADPAVLRAAENFGITIVRCIPSDLTAGLFKDGLDQFGENQLTARGL